MNEQYQNFVDKILKDLGLENLPEDKKNEVVETIKKRMDQKILITLMSNLKDQDLKELDNLTEKGLPIEEIVKFMSSRVENLDDKITQALGELYEQVVTDVKMISQKMKQK